MSLLQDLCHTARRVAPSAMLASVLLTVSFATALTIPWFFDRTTYEVFEGYAIRWTLVVSTLFLGGLVVFSDRIFIRKCNRFTSAIVAILILHVLYAMWFHSDSVKSNLGYLDSHGPYTYFSMTVAMTFGFSMWSYFRKLAVEHEDDDQKTIPRFSIGSILTWLSFGALMLTLIQRSSAFPVPTDSSLLSDPLEEPVAAFTAVFLLLPLISNWLMKTRHYFRDAASILIIVFAGSWIVFGLIGLGQPQYELSDRYLVKIASFAFATLIYLVWLAVMKRLLWRCDVRWTMDSKSPATRSPLAIVGSILWVSFFLWLLLNVAMPTANRHVSWVDDSPEIKQSFREVFGEELIEQLDRQHHPESTRDWINCLARHDVPKEKDVLFQIASVTRLQSLEGIAGAKQKSAMGFTPEQIESQPEEFPYPEIFYRAAHMRLPNKTNRALLKQAQGQCEKIRNAIARSEGACFIVTDAGWEPLKTIRKFAFDMLLSETKFAIKVLDIELALKNVASLARLSNLMSRNSLWQPLDRFQQETRAMAILLYVADEVALKPEEAQQLLEIAEQFAAPKTQTDRTLVLALANTVLDYRNIIEPRCTLVERPLLGSLINDFPQCIDWSEYICAAKNEIFRTSKLHDDLSLEKLDRHELKRLALPSTRKRVGQFHRQAIDVVAFPGFRSRRLARHCMDQWRLNDLRIQNWIKTRLSLVALKLMLYRNQHGYFPTKLDAIDGPIIDPFSGKLLAYWPTGTRFKLYSRGPDEADDTISLGLRDDIVFEWPDGIRHRLLQ